MNGKNNISTLLLGILAALILLIGQSGIYTVQFENSTMAENTEISSEKKQEIPESNSASYLIQANNAVSQVIEFSFDAGLHLIYDNAQEVIISFPEIDLGEIFPVKVYLETLLQRIISPNAP